MRVCARRKAVAFLFTNTQTHPHTLSLVNGIKQLGDNSPDGQTRNQASIRLPASSSPYPFNHSISLAHTHRHLPHTWNYNYIFRFPTAAKQLPGWRFPRLINQTHRSSLIVRHNKTPLKISELKPSITDKSGAKHSPRRRAGPHQLSVCFSSAPFLLRAPCYLTT